MPTRGGLARTSRDRDAPLTPTPLPSESAGGDPMDVRDLAPETLVRDVLSNIAGAPKAFERHRVDYCCHGALPLADACQRVGASLSDVLAALADEAAKPDAEPPWRDAFEHTSLGELVEHLVRDVHAESRAEVATLQARAHSLAERDPSMREIALAVDDLAAEFGPHLTFEERHVFPYIVALERDGEIPPALYHSVSDPVSRLLREHEHTDHLLDRLRTLTRGYEPAPSASADVVELFRGLAKNDKTLIRHMHLEGNVLFPRALEIEDELRPPSFRRGRR